MDKQFPQERIAAKNDGHPAVFLEKKKESTYTLGACTQMDKERDR